MRDSLGRVQSAMVLGGGSEIGTAVARRLAASGCKTLVLAARDPEGASVAAAARELRAIASGIEVETTAFDALDTASHKAVIDAVFDRHGDIDLVLVAFGVLGEQATFDADPEAAAVAVRTNYVGLVSSVLAVAGRLRVQGHGTIVVLSSVAGERVRKTNFVYGSSKAAIDAFAQGLGDSLVDDGIRVLVVRPGFVKGRMTAGMKPAPLSSTPDDVADAVVSGLARNADVVWVPGTLRWLMAVMRHLPRPLWRRVSNR